MEQKLVKVPFEVELAKKITNGGVEGRIVTDNGSEVRIVCFDMLDDKGSIIGLRKDDNYKEIALTFNDSGYCVQNPSRKLMLEIPEYMTFKDGDVVVTGNIAVVIRNPKMDDLNGFCFRLYVAYDFKKNSLFYCADFINQERVRLATENEKQILIDALKSSKGQRAKEYLKRFFGVEQKQEYEFKPFDKVLVKDHDEDSEWRCGLFSHKNEDGLYICVGSIYEQCIPYEGNEHLLGTTDSPEHIY